MDNPVPCGNNCPGIGDFDARVLFQNLVYGLADNTDIALDSPAEHQILAIFVKATGNLFKKGLNLVDGSGNVVEVCLRCLSIDKLFGFVQFLFEVGIPYGIVFYKIHISLEKIFQGKLETEIIISVHHERQGFAVENNGKVNVTVLVESTGEDRSEDI